VGWGVRSFDSADTCEKGFAATGGTDAEDDGHRRMMPDFLGFDTAGLLNW